MRATQGLLELKTQKHKEFATLIGRRLREAYVTSSPGVLSETIERHLTLLREAEARAGAGMLRSGPDVVAVQRRRPIGN